MVLRYFELTETNYLGHFYIDECTTSTSDILGLEINLILVLV